MKRASITIVFALLVPVVSGAQGLLTDAMNCVRVEWKEPNCHRSVDTCWRAFTIENNCGHTVSFTYGTNEYGNNPQDFKYTLTIRDGRRKNSHGLSLPIGTNARMSYCAEYSDARLRERYQFTTCR